MIPIEINTPITRMLGVYCNSIKCHECILYGEKECKTSMKRMLKERGLILTIKGR